MRCAAGAAASVPLQAPTLSPSRLPAAAAVFPLYAGAGVAYLIIKPFLGKRGRHEGRSASRAVEHGEMKDAAAKLTQMTDEMLHSVMEESRLERLRIQQEAEGSRELPMVHSR